MEAMPENCPTCGHRLAVTRLRCPDCATEVDGTFSHGRLVNLPEPHATLLELFLRSRGNMKELERHLGVSYPTARQRYSELLGRLGFEEKAAPLDRDRVLADLAAGRISVDQAENLLRG